jgi:hypothetical protein
MRFRGDQPRTTHFGRVKSGELYSVSPMATLGPTVREFSKFLEREKTSRVKSTEEAQCGRTRQRVEEYDESVEENSQLTHTRVRESTVRGFESRWFESSRVREFELTSGVIPTVKSETNKESERLSG